MSIASDYDLLKRLASTDEAGGLAKERSVLLLWFLRNVVGLDDLDAYEYVCDGDLDAGIDGLFLEPSSGDEDHETLVIYQSKYSVRPVQVGPRSLTRLIAAAAHFKDPDSLEALLNTDIEDKLRALIVEFGLLRKLKDGWYSGRLKVRLVLVATGTPTQEAGDLIDATNRDEGAGYLQLYDLTRLGPLARATAAPSPQNEPVSAACSDSEVVVIGTVPNRVAVAALKAKDIVEWGGLDSRALFALNVRRELAKSRVRDQLDGALRRHDEHADFLSYHNGMTVVCERFTLEDGTLTAEQPSIVNGAQSALAFARADAEGELTDDLRIFVKFVEVAGRPQLAKEVSWRSNTQTAVNARNLMALGGPQQRIKTEIDALYANYIYEIAPDASIDVPAGKTLIANDEAAQLLCAIYNAMPWLAVKRLSLFESGNHALIFNEHVTGAHVVLAQLVREAVDAGLETFPAAYRRSWRLTRLAAVYLVAQVLRASDNPDGWILEDPAAALADAANTRRKLELPVNIAATTLSQRHDRHEREGLPDIFSVDFKNPDQLQQLRDNARDGYYYAKNLGM